MKYCSNCAALLERRTPAGDDRPRGVCPACGAIHYENPRLVVGCLVEDDTGTILCRRAIEPARGLWTLPAGFLELGESTIAGAARETLEESGLRVRIVAPHALLDLPHIAQSYVIYRACALEPRGSFGGETLEVARFARDAIPWEELAFPVMHFALRLWLDDERHGGARMHLGTLRWSGHGSRFSAQNYALEDHLAVPLAASGA